MQSRPRHIDYATALGLAVGFGMIAAAIAFGGAPLAFLDWPSLLIVLGGTLAVTTVCFSFEEMKRAQIVIFNTLFRRDTAPGRAAALTLQLADQARKNGHLSLQALLRSGDLHPFQRRALQLVIDGVGPDEIERILRQDLHAMVGRHSKSASVLRKAAEVAPAMGLIGTLVGLVQMLGSLNDPASIGPSMALALLTTLYGAVLANMVFAPLAAKLERNSEEEALLNQIHILAAVSIGRKENPRRLEAMLNAILPPADRVRVYD